MNTKAFFGVAAAAVLTLAGCASSSDTRPTAAVTGPPIPDCPTGTASFRAETSPNCAGIGRTYSSKDLNRNGATSVGDAMRQLDPSITVHQ